MDEFEQQDENDGEPQESRQELQDKLVTRRVLSVSEETKKPLFSEPVEAQIDLEAQTEEPQPRPESLPSSETVVEEQEEQSQPHPPQTEEKDTDPDAEEKKENHDSNMCDICLDHYDVGDEVCWSTNPECNHAFHKDCILDWLSQHRTCPCCRRNYIQPEENSSIQVHLLTLEQRLSSLTQLVMAQVESRRLANLEQQGSGEEHQEGEQEQQGAHGGGREDGEQEEEHTLNSEEQNDQLRTASMTARE